MSSEVMQHCPLALHLSDQEMSESKDCMLLWSHELFRSYLRRRGLKSGNHTACRLVASVLFAVYVEEIFLPL